MKCVLKLKSPRIRIADYFEPSAGGMLSAARSQGLEGVIAKRRDSRYEAGKRSGSWAKYRLNSGQELDGRYLTALPPDLGKVMLYDFQTQRWSELARGDGAINWSHDSKFVYLRLKQGTQPAKLVRIHVPDGKIEQVADLKDITLGGYWSDWVSLLPDDSPLLLLGRSTEDIYGLNLQYR